MSEPVDRFLSETLAGMSGGLDPAVTEAALRDFQTAIRNQAAELAGAKYKRRRVKARCPECRTPQTFTLPAADPEVLAKASAATSKAADTFARLQEFLQGRPDSREAGGVDWLKLLSAEQLAQVQGWVEARGRQG
jgi:hypothetical protein